MSKKGAGLGYLESEWLWLNIELTQGTQRVFEENEEILKELGIFGSNEDGEIDSFAWSDFDVPVDALQRLAAYQQREEARLDKRGQDRFALKIFELETALKLWVIHHKIIDTQKSGTTPLSDSLKASMLTGYQIGLYMGVLATVEALNNKKSGAFDFIKSAIHSLQGKDFSDMRWAAHRELKKEVNRIADEIWSNGDSALHVEMAEHLSNKTRFPQFSELSQKDIRRAIIPAATKHKRLFGTSGTKKEK